MATVDLDWSALDDTLSAKLVDLFNKHLATAKRPSFLGPVSVLGFEFGDSSPEVEVVDMQDIYPDFLIDDEDEDETHRQEPSAEEGVKHGHMGAAYNQPWSPPLRNLNQSSKHLRDWRGMNLTHLCVMIEQICLVPEDNPRGEVPTLELPPSYRRRQRHSHPFRQTNHQHLACSHHRSIQIYNFICTLPTIQTFASLYQLHFSSTIRRHYSCLCL